MKSPFSPEAILVLRHWAIAFCQQLTDTVAIAFLTDDPLEAPLKGFPPHQPNLISAIETWLEES